MARITDALTGAGSLNAAPWAVTSPGDWQRSASGVLQVQTTGAYRKAANTAPLESVDYRVGATFAYDSDASFGHGVATRWATGGTISAMILIRFADEVYRIRLNAGGEVDATLLGTFGTGALALELHSQGSTHRAYVGGALEDTWTDATLLTGPPGLVAYGGNTAGAGNTTYATNWFAEDLYSVALRRRGGYTLYRR